MANWTICKQQSFGGGIRRICGNQ